MSQTVVKRERSIKNNIQIFRLILNHLRKYRTNNISESSRCSSFYQFDRSIKNVAYFLAVRKRMLSWLAFVWYHRPPLARVPIWLVNKLIKALHNFRRRWRRKYTKININCGRTINPIAQPQTESESWISTSMVYPPNNSTVTDIRNQNAIGKMICFNFCDAHNKWSLDIWTIDWDATSGQTDERTSGRTNRIQISELESESEFRDQRDPYRQYSIARTHTHTDKHTQTMFVMHNKMWHSRQIWVLDSQSSHNSTRLD